MRDHSAGEESWVLAWCLRIRQTQQWASQSPHDFAVLLMTTVLNHVSRCLALFLSVALAGCASLDKYSFETFDKRPPSDRLYTDDEWPHRSDKLALRYADYQARLLEGRATGARVTREMSDSSLVVGGALAGAQQTLGIAASSIATMGVGMVITRELQGVFNARGRSEAFADAAYLIRQAQSEYRQFNPNPSPDHMTENGAILITRVDAAVHAARKTLNGRMPGLLDLQQATQPMTKDGADRESSGTPRTIFTAAGDKPDGMRTPTKEETDAAVDRKLADWERRQIANAGKRETQPVVRSDFQKKVGRLKRELKPIVGKELEDLWGARYPGAVFPGEEPARQKLFDDLTAFRDTPSKGDGTMSEATTTALTKWQADMGLLP